MTSGECVSSKNCTISRENFRVYRTCYEELTGDPRVDFCDCNNYFGFVGSDCTEPSIQTNTLRVLFFISIFISSVGLAWILRLYSRYRFIVARQKVPKYLRYGLLCAATALLSEFIRATGNLISLFDPQKTRLLTFTVIGEETEIIANSLGYGSLALRTVELYFTCLLIVFVVLYWLTALDTALTALPYNKANNFLLFRRFSKFALFIFSFLLLFAGIQSLIVVMNIIGVVLSVLFAVFCTLSRKLLLEALDILKDWEEVIRLSAIIKQYSLRYFIFSFIFASSFLFYSLYEIAGRQLTEPGSFHFFWNIFELSYFIKSLLILYSLSFYNIVLNSLMHSSK